MKTVDEPATRISLSVNGRTHGFVLGHDIAAAQTLAEVLRERLGLTGLKVACDEGACGACTVIMDGRAVLSCMVLAVEAAGHEVFTIEGLPDDDPVVRAFACQCAPGHGTALQCGFCTPGSASALEVSMLRMRACGKGLRSTLAWSIPGKRMPSAISSR